MPASTHTTVDVCLIACSGIKATAPCKARDMYQGHMFKMARAYAEKHARRWFIISAKHGLLDPNMTIEPYDLSPAKMSKIERICWTTDVRRQVIELNLGGDRLVILAGKIHSRILPNELKSRFREVEIPMTGLLGSGQFMQWLKTATDAPAAMTDKVAYSETIDFLEWLRPGAPSVLSAIIPDGAITTITADNTDKARKFIHTHNGTRNLYFSVNPTRHAVSKKAAKTDIAKIEYLLGDLDPKDNETPEQAKVRYLAALDAYPLNPTAIIDSGNGIQALWKLSTPIDLPLPVKDAEGKWVLSPEAKTVIDDVEGRIKLLMQALGSVVGTQNIDRILRLPGTINLPNAKKIREGRVACSTSLIKFNGVSHPFEDFPKPEIEPTTTKTTQGAKNSDATPGNSTTNDAPLNIFETGLLPDDLMLLIRDGLPKGDRSKQFHGAIGALKDRRWPVEDIIKLFEAYPNGPRAKYKHKWKDQVYRCYRKLDDPPQLEQASDDDDGADTVDSNPQEVISNPPPPSRRPIIQITAGGLSTNADQAQKCLKAAQVQFYERGGLLVRHTTKEVIAATEGGKERRTKVAQLQQVDVVYMRDMLSRIIDWQKFDGRTKKWVSTNPPFEIASTILGRNGEWPFPTINGVITTPTMRPDGSLLLEAGYDPVTRLLLVAPPALPKMSDHPTRADALAALKLLEDLLEEFPFDGDVSEAVGLSACITPVVRGAFVMTPAHIAKAAIPGSGKSYLFDTVAAIAIGQFMPVMAAGRSEEETEKRMGAALMAGQPLISIDNVNGELGGDALAQYLERPSVDIRVLGISKLINVEARGTSMFANGNNITLRGDVVRRGITTTLDPRLERPETRKFNKKPREIVLADRGKYIAACLTICRAYVAAGRPFQIDPLASYEGWSDLVRSALMWLGKKDPVDSMEGARAEDPERIRRKNLLTTWADVIGIGNDSKCTAAKAVHTARKSTGIPPEPLHQELRDAMTAVARRRGDNVDSDDPIDNEVFGKWLRSNKGKIEDGLRFTNTPNPNGAAFWYVEHIDGKAAEQQYRDQRSQRKSAGPATTEPAGSSDQGDVPFDSDRPK